jgi:hypothetical protein
VPDGAIASTTYELLWPVPLSGCRHRS